MEENTTGKFFVKEQVPVTEGGSDSAERGVESNEDNEDWRDVDDICADDTDDNIGLKDDCDGNDEEVINCIGREDGFKALFENCGVDWTWDNAIEFGVFVIDGNDGNDGNNGKDGNDIDDGTNDDEDKGKQERGNKVEEIGVKVFVDKEVVDVNDIGKTVDKGTCVEEIAFLAEAVALNNCIEGYDIDDGIDDKVGAAEIDDCTVTLVVFDSNSSGEERLVEVTPTKLSRGIIESD